MIIVDVIVVTALTGQVSNAPFHAVKGVTVNRATPSSPSELAAGAVAPRFGALCLLARFRECQPLALPSFAQPPVV